MNTNMLGLQFTVRNAAGNIDTGTLSLSGDSEVIQMAGIEDISLNTSAAAISGYTREGGDLIITLIGGKTIRLEGFFDGGEKELLLSERGMISEVNFFENVDGSIDASYGAVDLSGKWSEYDQLVFLDLERIEPVVAPVAGALGLGPLLGLGGAAAGAAVIDGLGGNADTTAPNVSITSGTQSTGSLINGEDYDSGVFTIGGTGEAGAQVTVVVNGTTQTTVVGGDGSWSVDFNSISISEGEYTTGVVVTATDAAGNSTTITDTLLVDTEAEALTFNSVAGDNIINIDEASGAVSVSGMSEAGATVVITLEGQSATTTVAGDGSWSVSFDGSQFPQGTYDSVISATVTDAAGNAASYTHDVHIDLDSFVSINAGSVGGDGNVSAAEMTAGVTVNGSGEPGSTVVVTVAGASLTSTVGANGVWSVTYPNGSLPEGTYTATVTAVATDAAGNSSTSTGAFEIDTEIGVTIDTGFAGGDQVVNFNEQGAPLSFTGDAEPGASVVVTLQGVEMTTVANASGVWSVTLPAGSLPTGEYSTTLTAVATDSFGNTATTSTSVAVDTVVGDVALSSAPVEGDNVINFQEASDGVWISGTATPGLDVLVTLGSVAHTVVASPAGTWTLKFDAGEIAQGQYVTEVTASISDAAGNSKTVTRGLDVDTFVENFNNLSEFGGSDGVVNAQEAAQGVELNGVVEANASVVVMVGGSSFATNADASGNWALEIPPYVIPSGEGDVPITVTATDAAGNTAVLNDTLAYDTLVNELALSGSVGGGDATFNAEEMASGVVLTGDVEPGSTVFVTVDGTTHQAMVNANGEWLVQFAEGEIAGGERSVEVTITATDAAGNTRTETSDIEIDTLATEPVVEAVMRGTDGVRSVSVEASEDDVTAFAVSEKGVVSEVSSTNVDVGDETMMIFGNEVPNGSQIVLSSQDDAGNRSDTLFVQDTATTRPDGVMFAVDIDNAGLDDFDIGAIDLQFVNGGEVTINASDLARLTGADNALTIHGGEDDRVVLEGATSTGESAVIDGQAYDIYSIGSEGQVLVDREIEVLLP